jgi:hypothetical protein
MKNHLPRIIAIACITLAAFGSPSAARAADNQPRMDKAIELLEKAKRDSKPVTLLEKAKEHVENASANKGGRRVAAMKAINPTAASESLLGVSVTG